MFFFVNQLHDFQVTAAYNDPTSVYENEISGGKA